MIIRFKVFGPLLKALGQKTKELDIQEGVTVRQAIDNLIEVGGQDLHDLIIDDDHISGNLIVMLNRRDISTLSGEDTPVEDGNEITILPHVQGG